jgi:drug/metabolite transporter (DMT)-like permease
MSTGRATGLALALTSAAAFAMSGPLAGSLIAAGWTPGAAVLARVLLAALVLTAPAAVALRGQWSVLRRGGRTIVAYGLVAVAGAQLAYFNAVSHLSVGVALLLEYQGTVLVVGWLWLRHGRRPRRLTLAGSVLALVGLALVLDVAGGLRLDGVGVVWGLAAAVGLATYFVIASDDREPVPALVLSCAGLWVGAAGLMAAGAAGVVPMRATTAQVELLGRSTSWVVPVLGLALVAAAFAYVVGTAAARLLGATLASFAGLTEVVFAVLFAWVLVGQLPAPLQLLGGAVILGGIALVRADELRRRPTAPPWGEGSGRGRAPEELVRG